MNPRPQNIEVNPKGMHRHKAIVLGAGGLVGQRLQQRLVNHPMFEIAAVAGSPSSAGRQLSEIAWRLDEPRPALPEMVVVDSNAENLSELCRSMNIEYAFSALPSSIAIDVEKALVNAGITVFSNASSYRRVQGVPLLIPEINPQHYHESRHYCATNCTLIPLVLPVAALAKTTEIRSVKMRSEQALSGAGWSLLFDDDALAGRVNPSIEGEAEKTAAEFLHVMGECSDQSVTPAGMDVEIHCERVARPNGHQVFVELVTSQPLNHDQIIEAFRMLGLGGELPSRPNQAIHLVEQIDVDRHLWSDGTSFNDDPDPSKDLKTGMAVVVGNLSVNGCKITFSAYSHNTVRGAAGGVVYLAEFVLANAS